MNRYISPHQNQVLYTNNGTGKYRFEYGVLIVDTDIVGVVDTSISENNLQFLFTDWTGGTPDEATATPEQALQRAGLGDLEDAAKRNRTYLFYKANPIAIGVGSVAAVPGTYYIVLAGSVIYKSVTYVKGQTFVADGDIEDTTGVPGSQFAAYFPPSVSEQPNQYYAENFKIKHLLSGNEYAAYWLQGTDYGFSPQAPGFVE